MKKKENYIWMMKWRNNVFSLFFNWGGGWNSYKRKNEVKIL